MATAIFRSISKQDVFLERLDAVIMMVPRFTGIADDVLAKGDDDISYDVADISLLVMAQSNYLKFKPDKIKFKTKE